MQYIKDRQYYVDLYDLLTIKNCIYSIGLMRKNIKKDKKEIDSFKLADKKGFVGALGEYILYFKKGEEYRNKEKTINEWIEKDKIKQDKYDNTKEPVNVFCDKCNWEMRLDGKSLHDFSDEPMRMLFFFRCPKCQKGKGVFEDGEIYKPMVEKCPDCEKELNSEKIRKDEVITTNYTCKCGYKNTEIWDLKADEKEHNKREKHDKLLLEKFREMFCLSKDDGDEYLASQSRLDSSLKQIEEIKEKEANPKYQKMKGLKKLKVGEMQSLIEKVVNDNNYTRLNFEKPEVDRYVIIPFTVQDDKKERSDYDSGRDLRRAITKTLEDTNWRLMSDGITNRLGMLCGKIKGYESEEDLMKIIKDD